MEEPIPQSEPTLAPADGGAQAPPDDQGAVAQPPAPDGAAGEEPAPAEPTDVEAGQGPPKFRDRAALVADVGEEMAARIEEVAPHPPTFVQGDPPSLDRWEACAKLGAAAALLHGEGQPLSEQQQFATHAAWALFEDDRHTLD